MGKISKMVVAIRDSVSSTKLLFLLCTFFLPWLKLLEPDFQSALLPGYFKILKLMNSIPWAYVGLIFLCYWILNNSIQLMNRVRDLEGEKYRTPLATVKAFLLQKASQADILRSEIDTLTFDKTRAWAYRALMGIQMTLERGDFDRFQLMYNDLDSPLMGRSSSEVIDHVLDSCQGMLRRIAGEITEIKKTNFSKRSRTFTGKVREERRRLCGRDRSLKCLG